MLVDPEGDGVFRLDPVATRFWELAGRGLEQGDVVASLAREHGVEEAVVERDLEPFVAELLDRGLLLEES